MLKKSAMGPPIPAPTTPAPAPARLEIPRYRPASSGGTRSVPNAQLVEMKSPVADPMKAVRAIYDHFELDLPEASEAQMQSWADENRQHKHGTHDYEMDRYGLTAEMVKSRLAAYIDRYQLPTD